MHQPHTLRPLLQAAMVFLAAAPLAAEPLQTTPGATLIVPYFEVDLDAPDGRTTLVTVGNAGEPVIAHATVWTDWGKPVYSWDIYLGKNAIATYNLRDLLAFGNLPPTGGTAVFPNCSNPVATPPLSPAGVLLLQEQLTGQDIGHGRCVSESRDDLTLATGSLTIDTVNGCSSGLRYPVEMGYFGGPQPLASPRTVLWGDFTYVDPDENFAQGYEAFALGIAGNAEHSFGGWLGGTTGVARETLGLGCQRQRFLKGGPFAAQTSLFVYTPPRQEPEDDPRCSPPYPYPHTGAAFSFRVYDEEGRSDSSVHFPTRRNTVRVDLGADLGVTLTGGYVDVGSNRLEGAVIIPYFVTTEHLAYGAIRASGRFAVGISATPLAGECQ